jgi:hypothetical protein
MDAMPIDQIDNTMNQPIELAKKMARQAGRVV